MTYSYEQIIGFKEERDLTVEKLKTLRNARVIEPAAAVQFQLDQQIRQTETHIADLDQKIAAGYDLGTDSGKERLRRVVANLKISEDMGPEHLVNCNRDEVREIFELGFEERKHRGDKNHYYFLSACPRQLPQALGERMIYELLGDLMDKHPNAVYFRTNKAQYDRVKLEKLPFRSSLEISQGLFKSFCAELFNWDESMTFRQALDDNLLPNNKCQYAVLPFLLEKKDWRPFFPAFFRWINQEFSNRNGGPVLLFFFVFYHENLHLAQDEKSGEIIKTVNDLCTEYYTPLNPDSEYKGHFYPLLPVQKSDLVSWFYGLGENNHARIDPVIKTLNESLPPDEAVLYTDETKYNMNRIEIVQEITFEHYNR